MSSFPNFLLKFQLRARSARFPAENALAVGPPCRLLTAPVNKYDGASLPLPIQRVLLEGLDGTTRKYKRPENMFVDDTLQGGGQETEEPVGEGNAPWQQ